MQSKILKICRDGSLEIRLDQTEDMYTIPVLNNVLKKRIIHGNGGRMLKINGLLIHMLYFPVLNNFL